MWTIRPAGFRSAWRNNAIFDRDETQSVCPHTVTTHPAESRRVWPLSFFPVSRRWERLQTELLRAYESLHACVTAECICWVYSTLLCVCLQTWGGCSDSGVLLTFMGPWHCLLSFSRCLFSDTGRLFKHAASSWMKLKLFYIQNAACTRADQCPRSVSYVNFHNEAEGVWCPIKQKSFCFKW